MWIMAVSAFSAAKTLCELRKWEISNLSLQKILYLAHMYHLGVNSGAPLILEEFEAWNYGPVVPDLYHRMKPFGSDYVGNVFHWVESVTPDQEEYRSLQMAAEGTRHMSPGQLVANTHSDDGAWAKVYRPNLRGIKIPNSAILDEYNTRLARRAAIS